MEQTFKFYPISNWVEREEKGSVFRSLRRASEMELYNFFKDRTDTIIEVYFNGIINGNFVQNFFSSNGMYDSWVRVVIHNSKEFLGIALFPSSIEAKEYFEYLEKIQFFADISCKD